MQGNALIYGNIQGNAKIWFVGGLFFLAGLFMFLILPMLITRNPVPSDVLTKGSIVDYASEDGSVASVYSFQIPDGRVVSGQSGVWSNRPSYKIGDAVDVYYSKENPNNSWIYNEKDLLLALGILKILGLYFLVVGLLILVLKFSNMGNMSIEVLVGTIGALSYGIPATATLPGLYYAFLSRPNFLFDGSLTVFPMEMLMIGAIFSVTGIIDLVGTYFLVRRFFKRSI